jgi:hypothetical protein
MDQKQALRKLDELAATLDSVHKCVDESKQKLLDARLALATLLGNDATAEAVLTEQRHAAASRDTSPSGPARLAR